MYLSDDVTGVPDDSSTLFYKNNLRGGACSAKFLLKSCLRHTHNPSAALPFVCRLSRRFVVFIYFKHGRALNHRSLSRPPTVPSAPILQLEPLNCTSIVARWQPSSESAAVQGYRLCYHEEGHPEQPAVPLQAHSSSYTISGLGTSCSLPLVLPVTRGGLEPLFICIFAFCPDQYG